MGVHWVYDTVVLTKNTSHAASTRASHGLTNDSSHVTTPLVAVHSTQDDSVTGPGVPISSKNRLTHDPRNPKMTGRDTYWRDKGTRGLDTTDREPEVREVDVV